MNSPVEIRDIQLPLGVDMFPIAYGWWIVLLGIVLLLIIARLIVWGINTSKKHYALKELKNINTDNVIDGAIKMSLLLRRICNIKYKNASVLYGKEWVSFLKTHTKTKIDDKSAELLIFAPFINDNNNKYSSKDAENLKQFCNSFIGDNL